MTDNEIIKALECCGNNECSKCPLQDGVCSEKDVMKLTLDLINRQQAEIERLQTEKDNFIKTYKECQVEVIKEFAERLCEDRLSNDPVVIAVKVELKELVGR